MQTQTEGVLAKVSQQLLHLEKRDGELWLIVSLAGLMVGAGLLAILLPAAFLGQGNIHFEITVSRPLVLGLVALLALLNTYLVSRRMEIRRVREELISRTIQQELVQQQSFTDPLTEIYNRHSLEDMAGRFISHARSTKKPLTLIMIDVDRFKDVNTRFGHLTGDVVLANTAALLKHSVRGSDAVFRYGGDEFLVILADTSCADAGHVVARITAGLLSGAFDSGRLPLLRTQSFNGVKIRSFPGRVVSKTDPDEGGEEDREQHRANTHHRVPARQAGDYGRRGDPDYGSGTSTGNR